MHIKQTKIIATISDINCGLDLLSRLFENGMNIVRMNTAHQSPEDTLKIVRNVRTVSESIALLIDTKGPEVRTRAISEKMKVNQDETVYVGQYTGAEKHFEVSYENFVNEVPVGAQLLIDDGSIKLQVEDKTSAYLICKVDNPGLISNKKSVNVPDVHLNVPSLSEKDRQYIQFAIDHDLDFIAHSFVRNKEDVIEIQNLLDKQKSRVKIIAKIENKEGVKHLEEILDHAYGVMIARGDLGVEMPGEIVPVIQKNIINTCVKRAQPVITATQMLHSMIDQPAPTRAEISDVANAIYDGTDAIMLSGETAYGQYPVQAVKVMTKIAKSVENDKPRINDLPVFQSNNKIRNYLAKCTVNAALELPVKAIICDSQTGFSSRTVSAYRGHVPIYAKCHDMRTVRELMLSYGIYPSYMKQPETTGELVHNSLLALLEEKKIESSDIVAILAGVPGYCDGTDFLEINKVRFFLEKKRTL